MSINKYAINVIIFLMILMVFVLFFASNNYSLGPDFAHHYALTSRIFDYGYQFKVPDPSLGEMNIYPRYSHALAAYLGRIFGSPLLGVQAVILISIISIWSTLLFMLRSFPSRAFECALPLFLIALYFFLKNGFDISGGEIVGSFFYSQLLSQAIIIIVIGLSFLGESKGYPRYVGYSILTAGVFLAEGAHLLPAVELYGFLLLLIGYDFCVSTQKRFFPIALLVMLMVLVAVLMFKHPTYATLSEISKNNGGLYIKHIANERELFFFALLVLILAGLLLMKWTFRFSPTEQRNSLAVKYASILSAAVSLGCIMQIVLFTLGHGSEYACKKYIYGLNTALLFEVVLIPLVFFKRDFFGDNCSLLSTRIVTVIFKYLGLPCALVIVFIFIFHGHRLFPIEKLFIAEQTARLIKTDDTTKPPHMFDYAIFGLPDESSGLSYFISIGVFEAPRQADLIEILIHNKLSSYGEAYHILTDIGNKQLDILPCRKEIYANTYVLLSAECISKYKSQKEI